MKELTAPYYHLVKWTSDVSCSLLKTFAPFKNWVSGHKSYITIEISVKFHFYMPMKNLHAYWRMEYVEVPQSEKTKDKDPFLEIPREDEATSLLIFRSQLCYSALNKFPYNPGHAMIIPYRQIADIQDLTEEEYGDICRSVLKMQKILIDALKPDGFNIGYNLGAAAGAGIANHVHCHVVPRWEGDTNFMPVIGQTKVLPMALEKMVARLKTFI